MLLGRRRSASERLAASRALPLGDDLMGRLSREWTRKLADEYARGLIDGMETTLRLLLGESFNGAPPCTGPVTPEVEAWARDALARIERDRRL